MVIDTSSSSEDDAMSRRLLSKFFSADISYEVFDYALVVGSSPAEELLRRYVSCFKIPTVFVYNLWQSSKLVSVDSAIVLNDLVNQNVIAHPIPNHLVMAYSADYRLGLVLFSESAAQKLSDFRELMLEGGGEAEGLIAYYREEVFGMAQVVTLWESVRLTENPRSIQRLRPQ